MEKSRREFLKEVAVLGAGAWTLGACARSAARVAAAAASPSFVRPTIANAGIQLFTVRDRLGDSFERTLAGLAEIGYREVEPFTYGSYTPEQIRGMLDRTGLRAPSTHVTLRPGPDLERMLAGFQAMGHRYARAGGAAPTRGPTAPTLDTVQRSIADYHEVARAAKPYGIKVIVHNHTEEFALLPDGRTPYDVMLAQLDPSLVVLELDIGWATVAGKDALALFEAHPGRFPLWHVKDMANLAAVNANGNDQVARMRAARIVPVGQGEIDYGPIFAAAGTAGLEHYFVEQDSAPESGDSLAAARTSFERVRTILQG